MHLRHTGSGLKLPIELELGNILSGENIKPNEEWRNLRYSNPGHIGVKRVLSSLRQPSILDKNVKKNACCVSNFRMLPSKPRSLKILPHSPPPPKKKQCWSVAGTFLFPTKQHWPRSGGGRGHHGAKFAGWVSCEKESVKFLTLSVQDCCYLRSASGLCHRKQCLYITALKIWFTSNLLRKNMIVTVNCFTSDSWLSELGNELLYSRIDRCT